jgi:hypothetical protein
VTRADAAAGSDFRNPHTSVRPLDFAHGCGDDHLDVRVLQALDEKPLQRIYALLGRP